MPDVLPPDFLGSLNIGRGLMALLVLIAWIGIVRAVTGMVLKTVVTFVASAFLMWALGVAPTVAGILEDIAQDAWSALVAVWRWIVGLFS
jgi:hypothetical protein